MTHFSRRDLFKRVGAVAGAALVPYATAKAATEAVTDAGFTPAVRADRFVDHQGREFMMVQMEQDVQEGDQIIQAIAHGHPGLILGVAMAAAPKGHFGFVQIRGPAQVHAVTVGGGGATALPMDPEVEPGRGSA